MEMIRLSASNVAKCAARAAEVLRAGGVVLYPTDTLYGLGADALSDEAVAKVRRIKGREEKKPIHCIVADIAMAERYAEVGSATRLLAEEFWPGPLTLVLRKKLEFTTGIARDIETIGIRIPKNNFCIALAREFGRPHTATSANVSGMPPERSVEAILAQLDEAARDIDIIIDAGTLPAQKPSTVVDVSGVHPIILREGAIPVSDIWDTLGIEPRSESA